MPRPRLVTLATLLFFLVALVGTLLLPDTAYAEPPEGGAEPDVVTATALRDPLAPGRQRDRARRRPVCTRA